MGRTQVSLRSAVAAVLITAVVSAGVTAFFCRGGGRALDRRATEGGRAAGKGEALPAGTDDESRIEQAESPAEEGPGTAAGVEVRISEYAKVFAPRLSGSPTTCQVSYQMISTASGDAARHPLKSVTLRVYKVGVPKPVFSREYPMDQVTRLGSQAYRLRWDGKTDNRLWAQGGRYRLRVTQHLPDGTWAATETPTEAPLHLVHVGIGAMDFVDYNAGDPRHCLYQLMFNEKGELDPTDVDIDVEWRVPNIYSREAPPSNVYTAHPRWHNWPACYMKGGKLRVMVWTEGEGYGWGSGLQLKIASPGCTPVLGDRDEGNIVPFAWYGFETEPGSSLPRTVNKHSSFPLPVNFYYVLDGKEVLLGTQPTTHILYTVNAPPGPMAREPNGRIYVATVDKSCVFVGGSDDVVGSIWNRLWNITMDVPGGTKPLICTHLESEMYKERGYITSELLDPDIENGSWHWGTCGAWGLFHAALLAVQGEPARAYAVFPKGSLGIDTIVVRDGLPAQNDPKPSQIEFDGHALVECSGRWYDPSYHLPKSSRGFSSIHEWEEAVITHYNYRHGGRRPNDPKKTEMQQGIQLRPSG